MALTFVASMPSFPTRPGVLQFQPTVLCNSKSPFNAVWAIHEHFEKNFFVDPETVVPADIMVPVVYLVHALIETTTVGLDHASSVVTTAKHSTLTFHTTHEKAAAYISYWENLDNATIDQLKSLQK